MSRRVLVPVFLDEATAAQLREYHANHEYLGSLDEVVDELISYAIDTKLSNEQDAYMAARLTETGL